MLPTMYILENEWFWPHKMYYEMCNASDETYIIVKWAYAYKLRYTKFASLKIFYIKTKF